MALGIWVCESCGATETVPLGEVGGPPPSEPMDFGTRKCEECGHEQQVEVPGRRDLGTPRK